jgi:GH35 family endo-1,4-beta-xylanase
VQKLHRKAAKLNAIFESSLILLAGESTRLMKEEAQLCVLDPTYNINTIVNDQHAGFLASIQIPTIENSAFDIDYTTLQFLPSGAMHYSGIIPVNHQKIEVLNYPNDDLNYVSADGKAYKKHL